MLSTIALFRDDFDQEVHCPDKSAVIDAYEEILNGLNYQCIETASHSLSDIIEIEFEFFKKDIIALYDKIIQFLEKQLPS